YSVRIAAKQLMERQSGHLALQIPERDVDRRNGPSGEAAPANQLGNPHCAPEALVVERILADELLFQSVDRRAGDPRRRAKSNAGNALVGVKLHDAKPGVGVGMLAVADWLVARPPVARARDVGDLHFLTSLFLGRLGSSGIDSPAASGPV